VSSISDVWEEGRKLTSALVSLRSDFKELKEAGYMPGYTRVSELDNVVSVAKRVNTLGVPLNALQAWDSDLITGEVVYLVLLMNFGSKYPVRGLCISGLPHADKTTSLLQVNPDSGTRGEVQFKVGISPKYKPSKTAIAAAFRAHSANTYTSTFMHLIILPGRILTLLITSSRRRRVPSHQPQRPSRLALLGCVPEGLADEEE
jgi:hypothetical protein